MAKAALRTSHLMLFLLKDVITTVTTATVTTAAFPTATISTITI